MGYFNYKFQPVGICGDIKKAFLQIRVRENERDCLKFHWSGKLNYYMLKMCWFTRLVFGLDQSIFTLESSLKIHLRNYIQMYGELI